ncbi:hypothetical protein I4N56_009815 [Pseudomonas mohnii]|uniref:hypothetical protein n=1 Tax=Pseudomonas mohnii TaxID=395600 RepID=UPI0018DC2BE7|nr:hypothetical protein [Pseudomonas mohnii]MBH8611208.1 hypothetical protein [Pseudomonas mohnii]
MRHALFLGGPAHGRIAGVEEDQPVVYWPNQDGTFSLYPKAALTHPGYPDHLLFVLAKNDPAEAILAFPTA